MYEITLNEDETISIDYWSRPTAAAREMRRESWEQLVEAWLKGGKTFDFDTSAIQHLFLESQIDGTRVLRMFEAGGDIGAAPIDPKPEFALEGENQMLTEELENEEIVFKGLRERLGVRTINFDYDPDVEKFVQMRLALKAEGLIHPGMRGL